MNYQLCRPVPYGLDPNTMTPLEKARIDLNKRFKEYKETNWRYAGEDAKKEEIHRLIELLEEVISMDPKDSLAQSSRFYLQEELTMMHAQNLVSKQKKHDEKEDPSSVEVDDIAKFVRENRDFNKEIARQARTFEDDYKKLMTGKMDYPTMRALYG